MRTSHLAARALGAGLLAAATLAACGSTGTNGVATKSTGTIVATAKDAVVNADTVHVQGDIGTGAQAIHLDLVLVKDKGASGQVVVNGEHIELLRLGQDVYVKGDEQFYRSVIAGLGQSPVPAPSTAPSAPSATPTASGEAKPSASATTPGDITVSAMQVNWLHIGPSDGSYQNYASLTDPKQLIDQILAGTGSLEKDGQKDIRGTKTIVLRGAKDSRIYVGIDGPAYLFRVLPAGGGTLDFMDFGSPVVLTPPPAAQVVDISKIAK